MKNVFALLIILISFLAASVTFAQEIPPPSEQTYVHNACLEGGFFEGKCDFPTEAEDEWAWACGFYYAMYVRGEITLAQAPDWCKFSIPVRFVFVPTPENPVFELCVQTGDETFPYSMLLIGEPNQPGNMVLYYESNTCDGASYTDPIMWVNVETAPDWEDDVSDLCDPFSTAYPWNGVINVFEGMQPIPGFSYLCHYLT